MVLLLLSVLPGLLLTSVEPAEQCNCDVQNAYRRALHRASAGLEGQGSPSGETLLEGI